MRPQLRDDKRISEEAAAWLETLAQGGAAEREAFAAWVKESPSHVKAFLLMTALDIELEGVDAQRRHATALPEGNVVTLAPAPPATMKERRSGRFMRPALWAAALAAMAVTAILAISFTAPRYSTAIGEQRTFDLPDGSVVSLNTQSKVILEFSDTARDIRLVEGEALFKVARDSSRPFRVRTQDAVIQAVGTEFNVRHDAQGTRVAVIEGKVRVAEQATPLVAGESATIHRDAGTIERAATDVDKELSWRERRLMFRTDTLEDIAAEFNRYNRFPQIRIEDAALNSRRFSGVFDADDPESFAQVLEGNGGVSVDRSEREILIREVDRRQQIQ